MDYTIFGFHKPTVMYSVFHHVKQITVLLLKSSLSRPGPLTTQQECYRYKFLLVQIVDIKLALSLLSHILPCPLSVCPSLPNTWGTSGQSLCEKKLQKQQSPSIKLSNWLGSSSEHLGLIAGWRIRIRWHPARRESEALGQSALCSQHISLCFTAHRGAARRRWVAGGRGEGGEGVIEGRRHESYECKSCSVQQLLLCQPEGGI